MLSSLLAWLTKQIQSVALQSNDWGYVKKTVRGSVLGCSYIYSNWVCILMQPKWHYPSTRRLGRTPKFAEVQRIFREENPKRVATPTQPTEHAQWTLNAGWLLGLGWNRRAQRGWNGVSWKRALLAAWLAGILDRSSPHFIISLFL